LDLVPEIMNEYELCIHRPSEYENKVEAISKIFQLNGKNRLKGDNCPVYIVGSLSKHR